MASAGVLALGALRLLGTSQTMEVAAPAPAPETTARPAANRPTGAPDAVVASDTARTAPQPRRVVPPLERPQPASRANGAAVARPRADGLPTAGTVLPLAPAPAAPPALPAGEILTALTEPTSPAAAPDAASDDTVRPTAGGREVAAIEGMAAALARLQNAYQQRSAPMVKALWPSVDEAALASAFAALRSQQVTFDHCETLAASATAGEMRCRGVTLYVPREGGQYQHTESRQWQFRMRRVGEAWVITSAATR